MDRSFGDSPKKIEKISGEIDFGYYQNKIQSQSKCLDIFSQREELLKALKRQEQALVHCNQRKEEKIQKIVLPKKRKKLKLDSIKTMEASENLIKPSARKL